MAQRLSTDEWRNISGRFIIERGVLSIKWFTICSCSVRQKITTETSPGQSPGIATDCGVSSPNCYIYNTALTLKTQVTSQKNGLKDCKSGSLVCAELKLTSWVWSWTSDATASIFQVLGRHTFETSPSLYGTGDQIQNSLHTRNVL